METKPYYQVKQVQCHNNHYHKWFVVGYNIRSKVVYLDQDGVWQPEMSTYWKDGGTYFNTRNEAEMALASTGMSDHTNNYTANVNLCHPR